jgi:hypothetical protein
MAFRRIFKNHFIVFLFFLLANVAFLYSNFGFYSFATYSPRPEFWDLYNTTGLWNCFKNVGLDLFVSTPSPLDMCRNFNYGYFSMLSMGLTNSVFGSIKFWGFLQITVFVFLVVRIYFRENSIFQKSKYLFALFSPGIFLLYASGNMDLQIICLLLIAGQLIVSGKEKFGLTLICITALLKFYTAPVLLIAILLVKRKDSRLYGSLLVFCTAFIILYQFINTPPVAFPDGAQNKFGSGIYDNYARKAGVPMSKLQGELLGLLLLFVMLSLIIFFYKKFTKSNENPVIKLTRSEEALAVNFLIMAGTSIICYLGALNVDYRLTFVALAGIGLQGLPEVKVKYISSVFPYVWLLSLWIVFPFADFKKYIGLDLQPIGDIFMIGTIAYFIFQGFYICTHLKGNYKSFK